MKKILNSIMIIVVAIFIFPIISFAANAPSAPSINSYTAVSSSSIKIGWKSVSGATKYRIDQRRSDESDYKTLTSSCTSTSYTSNNLMSGSTYYYRVYAINGAGTSKRSATYEAHTKPAAPNQPEVNRDSASQLTISWNNVSGATKYKLLYRRADESEYKTLSSNITGTSYTHTGLRAGTKYLYRVVALRECSVGEEGNRTTKTIASDESATKSKFTTASRPSNSIDNDNPTHVILKWSAALGDASYTYSIYRKSPYDSGFNKIGTTTDVKFTDTNAVSGQIYQYRIDIDGQSWTTGDFYAAPKITTPIWLTAYDLNSMQINWSTPIGGNGLTYKVRRWNGYDYDDIAVTSNTSYVDSGLITGANYQYYVQVLDSSGNFITSTYEKFTAVQPVDLGTGFYASIMTKENWLPLKANNGNAYLGNEVKAADTLWYFERDTDGSYKLSNAANGCVLDAAGWLNDPGTNVGIYDAHDDETKTNQRWYFFEVNGGYAIIPSYNMGLALDVAGGTIVPETNIQLWTRHNGAPQLFLINKDDNLRVKAPTLSVDTNASNITRFSWNSVPSAVGYKLTISQSDTVYKEEIVLNNEYSLELPTGSYSVVVQAYNHFERANSNAVSFDLQCSHAYGEWKIKSPATCTEDGIQYRQCTKCGQTETNTIPKLNHSYSEVIKDATCIENGEKYQLCNNCGDIKDRKVLLATGHSFPDEWTTEKEANCTETGIESEICTKCGEKQERAINALGHDYILYTDIPPNVDTSTPGARIYKCSECGVQYSETYMEEITGGTISIGNINTSGGGQVKIPVTISDNPGFSRLDIIIDYDTSALTPVEITKGSMLNAGTFVTNLDEDILPSLLKQLHITWNNDTNNITEDGELFFITFDVNVNAAENIYTLSVREKESSIFDGRDRCVMPTYTSGVINVADVTKGDIFTDGKINLLDSSLLAKYLAHYSKIKFTDKQLEAADIFEDGKVNTKDGVSLAQIIAGWINPVIKEFSLYSEDNSAEITVGSTTGVAGKYVNVPVIIDDNPGIAGFSLKLNYDKNSLTPVSIRDGDALADGGTIMDDKSVISNLHEDDIDSSELDYVTAYWNDNENLTKNGVLFTVQFLISENVNVNDILPIEISLDDDLMCNSNLNDVGINVNQGSIKIADDVSSIKYKINNVSMQSSDGIVYDDIPKNGDFYLDVDVQSVTDEYASAEVIAAAYDENGCLVLVNTDEIWTSDVYNLYINQSDADISTIKVFVWDSVDGMKPLAEYYQLE